MKLLSASVQGFRSLAAVDHIPTRNLTIVTGANDSGKTAFLDALSFLLGGTQLSVDDRTLVQSGESEGDDNASGGHVQTTIVEGLFALADSEQEESGFGFEVRVRRIQTGADSAKLELLRSVPSDDSLAEVETANRDRLREIAAEFDVEPSGNRSAAASWRDPLAVLAANAEHTDRWVDAPRELRSLLPRLVHFSSTREPDPRAEITSGLKEAYNRILDDEEITGPVRKAEAEVQKRLTEASEDLLAHVRERIPDLDTLRIVPLVSFREGFSGVELSELGADGGSVKIDYAGAGRRRRITLAVWEWTSKLVTGDDAPETDVIIAYDEADTHLDYSHQRVLVDLMRSQAAQPRIQVIAVTHSLNLIDKVDIADVVHLQRINNTTSAITLLRDEHGAVDAHLSGIASALGLRNSILLHERCFLAVEGSTETQAFPVLFRLATGYSLQGAGIALMSGNGNRGALDIAQYLNDNNRTIHFIIDADSATDPSTRKLFRPDALRAKGLSDEQMTLIGSPNELEELFTDEQWASTANAAWPRSDASQWTPAHFTSLRESGKFSSQLEGLVRPASPDAPSGKPGYLFELVQRLREPEDVPSSLHDAFAKVFRLANDP